MTTTGRYKNWKENPTKQYVKKNEKYEFLCTAIKLTLMLFKCNVSMSFSSASHHVCVIVNNFMVIYIKKDIWAIRKCDILFYLIMWWNFYDMAQFIINIKDICCHNLYWNLCR